MGSVCDNHDFSEQYLGGCPNKKIETCSEKGRVYSIEDTMQRFRIGKLRYDNYYYKGQGKASDYIFFTCSKTKDGSPLKIAIVVELKGHHTEKSYDQLIETLEREKDGILFSYVVITRSILQGITKAALNAPARERLIRLLTGINKMRGYTLKSKILHVISNGKPSESLYAIYESILNSV